MQHSEELLDKIIGNPGEITRASYRQFSKL